MNETILNDWQGKFTDWLRRNWVTDDGAHDIHHLHKVWQNCRLINDGETEKGDLLILLTAAYFHDLISLPKNHPGRTTSSLLSADKTKQLLEEVFTGFPPEKIAAIHHAIHAHSFSANVETKTTEAKILQDADRMEALGATGIARLFYTAGKMNAALYHANDPLATERIPDDKQFALDHIEVKLLKLPATMKTKTGQILAEKEADFIREFREKLVEEITLGRRQ
jgi:uncharacterized protein